MSREVFEIIRKMDLNCIKTQLALQCAPLITGIKASNFLIVDTDKVSLVCRILKKSSITVFKLAVSGERTTLLLYDRRLLEQILMEKRVHELLCALGYNIESLDCMLQLFAVKYQLHADGIGEFPHEAGVFLGYPVEDVKGFIDNKGKNFLYSGYWKVYKDPEKKICLFHSYEMAKEKLIRLVSSGEDITKLIKRAV